MCSVSRLLPRKGALTAPPRVGSQEHAASMHTHV
jgi:hypothetical protein